LVLTGFDGGDLEQYYNDLSEILDRSEVKTNEVCQRINAVEGAVEINVLMLLRVLLKRC